MFKINDQALIADYITEALGILHDLHFMEGLYPDTGRARPRILGGRGGGR